MGFNLFGLQLQKGYEGGKNLNITFVAKHQGDKEYKPAVQQAQMSVPRNTEGTEQHITFKPILSKTRKQKIHLQAISSAGLPVYFYIKEGPVAIKSNTLKVVKLPPRTRYPVKATVVAWQWGRSTSPKIKTAKNVEQTFYINK
jgi:hypothetical protein